MSCYSCATKFNFFHKEISCGNCGISFCSKCLKQKCKIPSNGNFEVNVCKPCYSKLAAGTSNLMEMDVSPPDAYLKRLENLENPSAPPITIYQQNSKMQKLRTGLSPADVQILERLEKLREDRKTKAPPPTEIELRNRLASLKGENPYVEEPTKNLFAPDTRSDQEKIDSILEQFVSERDIEFAYNPQEGIEARLASLREQGVRPNENSYISNLHDSSSSEEEIDKITRKIMDEVAIEQKYSKNVAGSSFDETEKSESPELLWCMICNKDATVQCLDCCGYYCSECNIKFHLDTNEDHHEMVRLKLKETE